jgi:HPt (histidine-containing phosphotransfer) domain-containing protein
MAENASSNDGPVDFDWLRECTDDDPGAMKTLLDTYFARTTTLLDELDKAVAAGNATEVRRVAHACTGSSGTCGMVKLTPLFKELEKKGAAGALDGAAQLAAQARDEFGRTREFVNRMAKS